MDRRKDDDVHEAVPGDQATRRSADEAAREADRGDVTKEPNPPRTTKGPMTSPKFGSAGSGGAELEPGPERP